MKLGIIDEILLAILVAGIVLALFYLALPPNIQTGTLQLEDEIPGTGWKLVDLSPTAGKASFKNTIMNYEYTTFVGRRFYAITIDQIKGSTVKYSVDMKFYKNIYIYAAAHLLLGIGIVLSIIVFMLRIDRLKEKLLSPTLLITTAYIIIGLPLIYALVLSIS
ncbi:hypothetical protein [Staphylothermus hellenicus]|uniref:Uncharacterized protein n=1 Tax=Staphylothermus hellenicus (strain DSM 12710 / JCM 10830 / BK20S6-10-b1 / P8) TaxID=591019 RepID=D7DA00_STAHD|nr:hypothetical protein [Staphylothermus hellenicus]ADI32596.1 hypothetical protein Shell_1508 [Staphylothermus hellenicus DSM 12710]